MNAMTRMMAAGLLALAMNGACRADSIYTFTIDDSYDGVTASGTITTGAADSGGYDVTSITGTLSDNDGSLTITGLDSTYNGGDNIVYPTSSSPVDNDGLSFDTSNGDAFNIYEVIRDNLNEEAHSYYAEATFTLTPASVPEPASLAMVACGLGLAGLTAWRRRRASKA